MKILASTLLFFILIDYKFHRHAAVEFSF